MQTDLCIYAKNRKAKRAESKGRAGEPKKSFRVFYKRLSFLLLVVVVIELH